MCTAKRFHVDNEEQNLQSGRLRGSNNAARASRPGLAVGILREKWHVRGKTSTC